MYSHTLDAYKLHALVSSFSFYAYTQSLQYEDIHEHELRYRTLLVHHLEQHRRVLHEQRRLLSQDHAEQLHNRIQLYERKLAQIDAETPEQKLNKYRDAMETMNDEMLSVDELDFEATGI